MTAREFSGVDHDLLADYIGGALDGTPEQQTVSGLVAADPAWRAAYDDLVRALDLVHADLAEWAAGPAPELPLAVADRITAALAGAGPAPAGDAPLGPGVDGDPADGRRGTVPAQATGGSRRTRGTTRPADGPDPRTGPGRRARRWARVAGPVAVAAASIAAVGLGLGNLVGAGDTGSAGLSSADKADAPAAAEGGARAFDRATAATTSSGTDYTPERLAGGLSTTFASPSQEKGFLGGPDMAPKGGRAAAPPALAQLARPAALDACLTAIGVEHGATPITVGLVDYASFQGLPALVVTFVDAAGARWAWASGPECGVPGSGADTRFRTRVG
ncbi:MULTISPECIES: hypothetical protein [Micromonospora]|uniref:Uncharacterized protein n=1 Tax=Micromonospora solifontis TaxID=2487138 RepID=A0ABX9WGH7_9ACTN|nr:MULTISPECIES: hypothetical protein [Micromonospora]NES16247.1 hypothetical protein [Micromonospora sp. PPF5-17B]NES38098.1 hypothetical protein [Micromonospora solifontis]NES57856.1 hypothetical protein [Micromonospora sp. PPF5-6]RNL97035.1 hypothetical protein EFE23_18370 [Micromonospora solifontis]